MDRLAAAFERLWLINPFSIAIVAFLLGLVPFAIAIQFSGIGDVAYLMPTDAATVCGPGDAENPKCLVKQVGYIHALNWSLVLLVLYPFALFFAFMSVQNAREAIEKVAANRMLVTKDWSAPVTDIAPIMKRLWRRFVLIGVAMFAIIFALLVRDWWCVVHVPLSLDVALGNVLGSKVREALIPESILRQIAASGCSWAGQENDWSVSATFGKVAGLGTPVPGHPPPSSVLNYAFSAFSYGILGVWTGLLFAYFGFVLALTITIWELNAGRFGSQLVLNLKSYDPRKRYGFEHFESVFAPCAYVATIAFIMAFLMRIQNLYLRDKEFSSIYSFMFDDIAEVLSKVAQIDFANPLGKISDVLSTMNKIFAFSQFSDPQSLLGAPAILLMLGVIAATLGFILRKAANDAQSRVMTALDDTGETGDRAVQFFGVPREEARTRALAVQTWPLSWPELRYAMRMFLMGIVCYVFYRVAFVWIGVVAAQAIYGGVSGKK